jgi:3-methyladenine DNA glycosylase/8-oxoguanine DNA glycosylase
VVSSKFFLVDLRQSTDLIRTCALHGRILSLKQDPKFVHYKVTWPEKQQEPLKPPMSAANDPIKDDTEELLRHYFSLYLDLGSLYKQWSEADPNFRKKAPQFTGVRILSQDAWETLVCFICSSNNNIARISQMVSEHKQFQCVVADPYSGSQTLHKLWTAHWPY